jgi:hypothetical protein
VGKTRATVQEAIRILGVSEGTSRKRVERGTLPHDKGEDVGGRGSGVSGTLAFDVPDMTAGRGNGQ